MTATKAPIVMVHGAFCGGWAFEHFRTPFEALGHEVLTPDLRGQSGSIAGVSMTDYARSIAQLCSGLSDPPVLIGHSLGGLVTQLAARRTRVRALVLLAPSPPWGVASSSVEEAATAFGLNVLGPVWLQAVTPDRTLMRTYSLDRVDKAESARVIELMGSESGRALWETLNWWLDPFMTTSLGPGPEAAPSLVIVGARDVVHPPSTARMIAGRLGATFKEMSGMSHWLPAEAGWEAVAAEVLSWLDTVKVQA
jgi:pimeloyl-ACP methyl ester carboxylesterase